MWQRRNELLLYTCTFTAYNVTAYAAHPKDTTPTRTRTMPLFSRRRGHNTRRSALLTTSERGHAVEVPAPAHDIARTRIALLEATVRARDPPSLRLHSHRLPRGGPCQSEHDPRGPAARQARARGHGASPPVPHGASVLTSPWLRIGARSRSSRPAYDEDQAGPGDQKHLSQTAARGCERARVLLSLDKRRRGPGLRYYPRIFLPLCDIIPISGVQLRPTSLSIRSW